MFFRPLKIFGYAHLWSFKVSTNFHIELRFPACLQMGVFCFIDFFQSTMIKTR